jgi:DNA recombination protein RmuC
MSSPLLIVLVGLAALAVALLVAVLAMLARRGRDDGAEARLATLIQAQAEISGKLSTVGQMLAGGQSDLTRSVTERLDQVSQRVGDGLSTGARATAEQLQKLEARLAVIDAAQANIGALSDQVSGLKAILGNKQARGAFGQGRMEAIVRDGLPTNAYSFQFTLSTRVRPDCVIHLPGDGRVLAIDAKFPLEAFEELRRATTPEDEQRAATRLRQDVIKHIKDIADKYLVPGETQEVALLFVPSEALYGELQERFDDVIQRAHRARVLVVSPSLLMLAIQVVQGLVHDAALRQQTTLIQDEVRALLDDVRRLGERVGKLKAHFGQVVDDLDKIEISKDKALKRGNRIEQLEFEAPAPRPEALPNPVARRTAAE